MTSVTTSPSGGQCGWLTEGRNVLSHVRKGFQAGCRQDSLRVCLRDAVRPSNRPFAAPGTGALVRLPLPGDALRRLQALSLENHRALWALPLSRERIRGWPDPSLISPAPHPGCGRIAAGPNTVPGCSLGHAQRATRPVLGWRGAAMSRQSTEAQVS